MEQMKMQGQNMRLLPVAVLLVVTPLLSASLRFKYLYFIVNILIISLGAEAGLLSFFLQSHHQPSSSSSILNVSPDITYSAAAEESASEDVDEDDQSVEDSIADQELFHKAETFIGNFYKQLKMQKQESLSKFCN